MNTYEINDRNEVVPYTSGRRCTDTMAWRDATELELQQQDEIKTLETELTAVTEQRDRLAEALRKIQRAGLVAVDAFDELDRIDEIVDEALADVKGGSDDFDQFRPFDF